MKILWFVSTLEDTAFVKEFSKSYDGQIDLFHLNYLTRIDTIGFNGENFYPIAPKSSRTTTAGVNNTFNVLSGRLTLDEAKKAYASTEYVLLNKINEISEYVFFIPSGRHVHHEAATKIAEKKGIERIYINYSNFPGYTFFDPKGTDCRSSIYENPSLLDSLYIDDVDIEPIFFKFSQLKQQQKNIPQATSTDLVKKAKNVAFIMDTILQKTTCFYGDRRLKYGVKAPNSFFLEYDLLPEENTYFFFPLQVSTDQQVLVNFDGGSIYKAIDMAIDIAEKNNTLLCVREHPAESKKDEVRRYLHEKRKTHHCLKIVNESVPFLIDTCNKVITINSTVGLEARLKSKQVVFLGRSFYEKSTELQLAKYLSRYLVCVDYHRPTINVKNMNHILSMKMLGQ